MTMIGRGEGSEPLFRLWPVRDMTEARFVQSMTRCRLEPLHAQASHALALISTAGWAVQMAKLLQLVPPQG